MSSTQFRFFFLLVPFPLSMSCPFSLGVPGDFNSRVLCTVCIFSEFKNCFNYPLRPKKCIYYVISCFLSILETKQFKELGNFSNMSERLA